MNKYKLEIAVFSCGAIVMIFELVGSRVLGPYLGTSIFVWTSLIGVILASLSLGYYIGGKMADNKPEKKMLSIIILTAGILILITFFIKNFILQGLAGGDVDIKIGSIISSITLFAPASILLGMISPYAARLKLKNLDSSGRTVGNLYAISTAGSIVGTFLSCFYLIPFFGTNKLLLILAAALVGISILISTNDKFKIKIFLLTTIIFSYLGINQFNLFSGRQGFIDIDSLYNRIWIYDYIDPKTQKKARIMGINNENHSSMFMDSDELVNEYTKYYHLARYFKPGFEKTLMIGGAGYSYPKNFLSTYENASIDVVEIDPKLTELAQKYFNLKLDPKINIYHQDARVYLNKTDNKYDVIFSDAFSSRYSIPYQITTLEAVQKKFDILENDGVVILNIISSINGQKGKFLRAEYSTYKAVFPQVYLFPVRDPDDENMVQNIILVALKTKQVPEFKTNDDELTEYLKHRWIEYINMDMPILTDNLAPVDYYINDII